MSHPPRFPHMCLVTIALVALACVPGSVSAQPSQEVAILAVEALSRDGQRVERLEVDRLSADAGGHRLDVLSLGDPGPWDLVVYVDQQLSASRSILLALEALAQQAEALTGLGEVQIVLVDEEPTNLLRTRDAELLRQALQDLALRTAGEHAVRHGRTGFLGRLTDDAVENDAAARLALAEELELLRQRQDTLVYWIGARGRPARPRAMLLLNDSLGLDPYDFYGRHLASEDATLFELGEAPDPEVLAQTAASYGWTVLPITVPLAADGEDERVNLRTNQSIGFRIGFGGRRNDDEDEEPAPQDLGLVDGREAALASLAAGTGGFLVADTESVPAAVERLATRRELRLSGAIPPGEPLPLSVTSSHSDIELLAPAWVGGSPESVAEVRIRRSLEGGGDAGSVPLRAKITFDPEHLISRPATLDLLVDLSDFATEDGSVPLRVSVGIHRQDGGLMLRHEVLDAGSAAGSTWAWSTELPIPPSTNAAVVLVQDLRGESFGENYAEFVSTAEAGAAAAEPSPTIATTEAVGPALRLLPLPSTARTGKVRVRSEARSDVDEVVFMLDGKRIGTRRRSPFDLRVDLGRIPRQRSIIAIAYDDAGNELGRDGLVVNEAATTFWVNITEPRPGKQVGPVDVVASVKTPDGRRLEGIEYFWNDERIDRTFAPPHRTRVLIPVDRPAGFIRVVATLDDGSTAEDVVLMNTERFEIEINVELVELYVVVTDRMGKPVRGLDSSDFRVREEEEVQEVESFSVAGDLPLTLGLAIDSSLSLFQKLPDVQQAATRFVASLDGARDRAFLVGFGSAPRLVQPTTGDLERIGRAIESLEPSGNTAVWQAIALSLDQLNQEPGRKALVVFYDGDDEDEQYSFRKTMELARRSLIPVYLIVMNDEAARTQGKGFAVRSRIAKLDELARTGGGRVFYVRTDEDLTSIFDDIAEELRSHYLLTYYPQRPLANPEWRPIQVEVTRSDLTARTISGYGGG